MKVRNNKDKSKFLNIFQLFYKTVNGNCLIFQNIFLFSVKVYTNVMKFIFQYKCKTQT